MTNQSTTDSMRRIPFLDSSGLLADPAALRARAAECGYLFFRGLLPPGEVLEVRRRFLRVLDQHGWLDKAADPLAGVADLEAFGREDPAEIGFCGVGVTPAAYRDIQRVRQFHELAHHPRLLEVFGSLFGNDVFPHPRNIARLMIAGDGATPTPPHQDFIHIQGTPNVWTAWLPLGDCPRELGGLAVLDGSHQDGLLSYKRTQGAGGLEAYLCDTDRAWAEGDFAAGDVLTFSSHTVHRALPNRRPGQVRLSCDFRYQPHGDEIEESSLKVHCGVLSWDEVYEGWPSGGTQWYWRDAVPPTSEWDESVRWQKDRIC